MIELPALNNPPLRRKAEKGIEEDLPSPMDPPEAYAPTTVEEIPYEFMAKPLQELMDDHEKFLKILTVFENALIELKKNTWHFTPEISAGLKGFFQAIDHEIARHTKREEKGLFLILAKKFLASGEHSPGENPVTPVDVMEADHAQVEQTSALVFNLLGLAPRLKDAESRNILFENAFAQGQEIVETMKLHIYKENTTLFPLAQRLLSEAEMREIEKTNKERNNE